MSVVSTGTPTSGSDSWGGPATTTSRSSFPNAPVTNVRDDWDDDEDDEAQADVEDPQRLWEEANKRAPMPQVVIASSSTSTAATLSPPPAAIQPVLRILKRPSATSHITPSSSGTSSPGSSITGTQTGASHSYAAREAAYHAARERIFGEGGVDESSESVPGIRAQTSPKAKGDRAATPAAVPIAREPKGPPSAETTGQKSPRGRDQSGESKGFANRLIAHSAGQFGDGTATASVSLAKLRAGTRADRLTVLSRCVVQLQAASSAPLAPPRISQIQCDLQAACGALGHEGFFAVLLAHKQPRSTPGSGTRDAFVSSAEYPVYSARARGLGVRRRSIDDNVAASTPHPRTLGIGAWPHKRPYDKTHEDSPRGSLSLVLAGILTAGSSANLICSRPTEA
ncbi:hypothetical protein VTO73DRAFT_10007 [Trametes versicolor]